MKNKKEIVGIYNPSKSGDFGFVDLLNDDKGYYIHGFNKNNALPGDEVLATIKNFKGRDEAVIKKVLKRSDKIFIGTFQEGSSKKKNKDISKKQIPFGFVIVRDDNFQKDVFVNGKHILNARNGDLVGVNIISFDDKRGSKFNNSPRGKIVGVLGNSKESNLLVDSYILESGFKQSFPHFINKELNKISYKIDLKKEFKLGRKDLRNLFTFTIDGEDAKDLDDAISIKKRKNGNFELYVHIADVSHYIKENSELDKIALKRATSVYLTDRVLPMLPEKLSNKLCSLNPNTDKLTLTCEILFSKNGVVKKAKVYESIINSNFRLTYKEVDQVLSPLSDKEKLNLGDKLSGAGILNQELKDNILICSQLKDNIEKTRSSSGVLDFEFPETKIILGTDLQNSSNDVFVKEIKPVSRYKSNKLIELFMVSANENVSKLYSDLPFLHRIHPNPNLEDIAKLQYSLNIFGVDFVLKKFDTKEFSNLLLKISKHKSKLVLEKIILRSLSKAIYSNENQGHFGLGLKFYSHFTSPIRRYSDLQIHRIIKEKNNGILSKKRIKHYNDILKNIADTSSLQENKAEKLEYKVKDYYTCLFYSNKIGEQFDALISGVIAKGVFVLLNDSSEGFINFKDYNNFLYNEELMHFYSKKQDKTYKIGDNLKVILDDVDMKELKINLKIV